MSGLPRYSKVPEETDPLTERLVKASRVSIESDHQGGATSGNVAGQSSSSGTKLFVTYIFDPDWPIQGERQEVLGPLCSSIQETLAVVRGAFDELAEYNDDRIVFYARVGKHDTSVRVLDSVWQEVLDKKPSHVRVHVKDGPGDSAARQRRNNLRALAIAAASVLSLFIFVLIVRS